ncbi:MAG TPA: hypothetical protein VGF56_04100 [Rhizomicrobium sp.]|jgi:hypothetical protein
MAALPFESKPGLKSGPQPAVANPDVLRREDPRIRLAQLARLHDEAAETATFANLLGRAPQIMAVLGAGALVVAGLSFGAMPLAQTIVWLALVAAGVAALWRSYARAIEAPFEIYPLKSFAGDLSAILFYAGFAWGAGAFLALAPQANIAAAALFLGMPGAVIVYAARGKGVFFLAPVCALVMAAIVLRPLGGFAAASLALAVAGVMTGVSLWLERLSAVPALEQPAALATQ